MMLRAPLGDVSNLQQTGKLGEKRARLDRRQGKAPVVKPRSNGKDRRKEARFRDREMDCMLLPQSSAMLPQFDGMQQQGYYDGMQQGAEYYDGYYMQPQCFDEMGNGMMGMQSMQPMQPAMVQPMMQPMGMQPLGMQPMMAQPLLQPLMQVQPWSMSEPTRQQPKERARKEPEDTFVYPGHPQYSPIDVTIKNTFINLPAPRTPSPSGRYASAQTPPVAATCPPKCLMGEQLRQEREEARAEAVEAAQLFAGIEKEDIKAVESQASVGSLLHRAGLCKPCAWVHHAKGCQRGSTCEFCHTCPAGEIKKRKKEKTVLIRKRRNQYTTGPLCAEYNAKVGSQQHPSQPQFDYAAW